MEESFKYRKKEVEIFQWQEGSLFINRPDFH